ncbi:MAG: HesA/MoeB/ThiF family protein [Bordetella sp.]|nr:MAG: HesA/MoeB/ThiF family protein [Bordetella sp.]
MKDQQLLRYARHILLDDLGIQGQKKLLSSHALIVGIGGLGSPAALYLAISGVGKLTLVDHDIVELSNLQRQILHTMKSLGYPKAESGKKHLFKFNPDIQIEAKVESISKLSLSNLIENVDIVIDCTDNFPTRYLLNKICVDKRKPLVSGAAIQFNGQISVYNLPFLESPCYNCCFPNIQEEEIDELANCATMGIFSPLVGIIGSMQAAEAIKLLSGVGKSLSGRLLYLDARIMEWKSIKIQRDPKCNICRYKL